MPVLLYETGSTLTEKEAGELFSSYDVDASETLEVSEVRLLLQDLTERRVGHRNVMDDEVEYAFSQMDSDNSGEV